MFMITDHWKEQGWLAIIFYLSYMYLLSIITVHVSVKDYMFHHQN